jgi:murein L,D-transpeptidase YcbB/YkuD
VILSGRIDLKLPHFTFMSKKIASLFMLVMQLFLWGCNEKPIVQESNQITDSIIKPRQLIDISLPGGFSSQTKLQFDSAAIPEFISLFPKFKTFEKRINRFYSKRKYAYAWFDQSGLIEQAGNLYNKLSNLSEEGLPEKQFYREIFDSLMTTLNSNDRLNEPDLQLELVLTANYFYYAQYVWEGLGQAGMKEVEWDLPHKKLSYEALLDSILKVPASSFYANEPVFYQYSKLKFYLKKHREIEAKGGWPLIKADAKPYKKGDSSIVISVIRKRLFLSDDLSSDDQSGKFDESLERAVKNFQERYGIKSNGIVNRMLIEEMNQPISKRIEQIIVNMERCRWVPVELNEDYFLVNIPEYRFHAYKRDSLIWSMDVVVGTEMNKTAIFNGMLNTIVFSPYWNVPSSIAKKEILPEIARNRKYLARNHMEWKGNAIRQKPGPWNALGKVKFLFPNSHSIYLHDTPSKHIFEKDRRAFSHGCIRVSEPKKLAMYVLRNQPEWTEASIDSAMNADKERYVKVTKPIPVFVAYFTSWVDNKGRLNFRNDVYRKDERLAEMIIEKLKG